MKEQVKTINLTDEQVEWLHGITTEALLQYSPVVMMVAERPQTLSGPALRQIERMTKDLEISSQLHIQVCNCIEKHPEKAESQGRARQILRDALVSARAAIDQFKRTQAQTPEARVNSALGLSGGSSEPPNPSPDAA